MISFFSQMFKSTDKQVETDSGMGDEMGMGRLVQMKDRSHSNDENHKDILSRVKSAEIGNSAKQLRFRKEESKAPSYSDWTTRRTA